jgi:hypothetical protein
MDFARSTCSNTLPREDFCAGDPLRGEGFFDITTSPELTSGDLLDKFLI